jgi:hypothetical protein
VAEEGGDIVGLDCVNGRSEQVVVERSQIFCAAEDDVGGVLGLKDAPVIAAEGLEIRKVPRDDGIEPRMQLLHHQPVGELLGFLPVVDRGECVVL